MLRIKKDSKKMLISVLIFISFTLFSQQNFANTSTATVANFNTSFQKHSELIAQAEFAKALPYAQQSYQLSKKLFSPLDKTRLVATDNYALNLQAVNQLSVARKIFIELLTSYEEKYGKHAQELMPLLADINSLNQQLPNEVSVDEVKAMKVREYKLYLRHNSDDFVTQFSDKTLPTTIHAKNTLKKVISHFDSAFDIYESKHWSIIYPSGQAAYVKNKMAKVIEKTYNNNISFLVALGVRNKPIEEKMTAVYFTSKKDYISYIKAITGDQYVARNSGGIYVHNAKTIFVYDRGTTPNGKKKYASPQALVHEVSHQVLFETRFQSLHVIYPRWFTEGLATSFEFHNIKLPFGPHTNNYSFQRVLPLDKRINNDSLITLKALVMFDGNDEKLNNTQNQADVYALGTMLIRFLYQYYPDEFKEYLSVIAKSRTALYERAKFGKNIRLKQFTKAFGDPEVMQDEFMAFSKAVIAESKLAYIAYKKQKEAKKKSAKKTI